MLSYLSEPKERLGFLKAGMERNLRRWSDQTVPIAEVDQVLLNLETKNREVEYSKQMQAQRLMEARDLSSSATDLADKIENMARGFHAGDENALLDYNIKGRKTKEAKPAPETKLKVTLEDDTDGEGFIVSVSSEPRADYYEWQKGVGTNASDVQTIPELKNYKTTGKTYFVDDEVPKGIRVFYRVRAGNSKGVGPWSEAASRVQ